MIVSIRAMSPERRELTKRRSIKGGPVSVVRAICVCLCCGPLLAGCAGLSRRPAPPPQYSDAHLVGFSRGIRWPGEMTERQFRHWETSHLAGMVRAAHGDPLKMLVLSGGGGAGAFGAGVLTGWSQLGTRPRFQIVTGVSVGALIAPFAFLGPAWDPQLSRAFEGAHSTSLLEPRLLGWLGALFGWSAYRGAPLRALVHRYVTPRLLRAVAAQAATGRLLLVATTDLDSGGTIVWNLGTIAAHGGPAALKLFRRVLVASASIPGDFPPVLIRVRASEGIFDEMQVDGSTTSPFLFAPGIVSILPRRLMPLHGATIYLIVNGHLRMRQRTTPNRTTSILMRSIAAALASDSRTRVKLLYSFARRQGMKLRVTEIPRSYQLGGFAENLRPARMSALFAYGRRCAREGRVWSDAFTILNRIARVRASAETVRCPVLAAPKSEPGARAARMRAHERPNNGPAVRSPRRGAGCAPTSGPSAQAARLRRRTSTES